MRVRHPYAKTTIGVAIVAVMLFPVYWMVLTSLRSETDAVHSPPLILPKALQTAAYTAAVFDNSEVQHAILNSTIISLGTMLLTLLLAVPAAYVLARRRQCQPLYRWLSHALSSLRTRCR